MANPTIRDHERDSQGRRLWRSGPMLYSTVYNRLKRGWTLEQATKTPLDKRQAVAVD